MTAGTFPVLAMNAPYTDILAPRNTPWRIISQRDRSLPCCFAFTLCLMPALLPEGDESAMNLEDLLSLPELFVLVLSP